MIQLKMEILPKAQQMLWPKLQGISKQFTLYGGTAVALQLGHRESVDFDFFSSQPLDREALILSLPFLSDCKLVQPTSNTINTFFSSEFGVVKLQFLSGLGVRQGLVKPPLVFGEEGFQIATLDDLLATKLNTIQSRAQLKDYLDIYAMLQHGLSLEYGLGCAIAIYGKSFDPGTSLKALTSYVEGDLAEAPKKISKYLIQKSISVTHIPTINPFILPGF